MSVWNMKTWRILHSQILSVLGRTKVQKIFINEQKMWRREYFGMVYYKHHWKSDATSVEYKLFGPLTIFLSSLWSFFYWIRQLSSCWWLFSLNNNLKVGCENDVNVSKEARVKQIHKFWKQYVKYVNQAQLSVRGCYIKLLRWLWKRLSLKTR